MKKKRLDLVLVERGLAESRNRAQALILAGSVEVAGEKVLKAGYLVAPGEEVQLTAKLPFVSRGGLKLEPALDCFGIELKGRVAIDVGASTGGFTDCLLKRGAELVYAVDVGYGQLAWELRQDPKVVVMERTNARYLEPEQFDPRPSFASVDVSFISLELILPALTSCLTGDWELVTLIKPQFEAGKEHVGKHGVVRDPKVQLEVLERLYDFAAEHGYPWQGLIHSPILGPEGNIEFLARWAKQEPKVEPEDLKKVISGAYRELKEGGCPWQ